MLRVFSNKMPLVRKYAKNERNLYRTNTQTFTNIGLPIPPFPQRFHYQKHCFCATICMLLRGKSMQIEGKTDIFSPKNALFKCKNTIYLAA